MFPVNRQTFEPERRKGLILHAAILLLLLIIAVVILWVALTRAHGGLFVLLMILLLLIFIAFPMVGYRAYALINAGYFLERDGLRLKWGLRLEDIPVTTVEWARLANESGFQISYPPFIWQGAILGHRVIRDLGDVEFIASDMEKLVLIATHGKVFAISPQDPKGFIASFQRILEMGSLSPIPSRSAKPAVFIRQVWQDRLAKLLLPMNFIFNFILWVVTGFIISNKQQIALGFSSSGLPLEKVPSELILLLPVLSVLVLITDLVMGLFFFRKEEARITAYLLWVGGIFTPALLLWAVVLLSLQS